MYEIPTISGYTYIVSNTDTTALPNVEIELLSEQIGKQLKQTEGRGMYEQIGIGFNRHYNLKSDESGTYSQHLGLAPYGMHHEVTFYKGGYDSLILILQVEVNQDIVFNAYLKKTENESKTTTFKQLEELGLKQRDQKNDSNFLFFGLIVFVIIVFLVVKLKLISKLRDYIFKLKSKKFVDWTKEDQEKVLNNVFCPDSMTQINMKYTSEEEISDMIFVHRTC